MEVDSASPALGTLEATDTLRRGYWLGLPLDMSNDDDLKASRNALGHSGRRIPHPVSQTRLPVSQTRLPNGCSCVALEFFLAVPRLEVRRVAVRSDER